MKLCETMPMRVSGSYGYDSVNMRSMWSLLSPFHYMLLWGVVAMPFLWCCVMAHIITVSFCHKIWWYAIRRWSYWETAWCNYSQGHQFGAQWWRMAESFHFQEQQTGVPPVTPGVHNYKATFIFLLQHAFNQCTSSSIQFSRVGVLDISFLVLKNFFHSLNSWVFKLWSIPGVNLQLRGDCVTILVKTVSLEELKGAKHNCKIQNYLHSESWLPIHSRVPVPSGT